jgi:hypothetical protein
VIRVILPSHLRTLARIDTAEVTLDVQGDATQATVLDALEVRYPVLCGAIRDRTSKRRRPFIRFFACERDLSHDSPEELLPVAVSSGEEPFLIVGAIAGG